MLSLALHASPNDSLIMAQSFINLSLTTNYFKKVPSDRVEKILTYIEHDLSNIQDASFINANRTILAACTAHLYLCKVRRWFRDGKDDSRHNLQLQSARLDSALLYADKSQESGYDRHNTFYQFINFSYENSRGLQWEIGSARARLHPALNRNIYPDFKRIYHYFEHTGEIRLDSLAYYANLFNIKLDSTVLQKKNVDAAGKYPMDISLDLISQYLQFQYILHNSGYKVNATRLYDAWRNFYHTLNFQDSGYLVEHWRTHPTPAPKDDFIRNTFTEKRCRDLLDQIRIRYPNMDVNDHLGNTEKDSSSASASMRQEKFYFPETAPFPSCKAAKAHFLPNKPLIKDIDAYMKNLLQASGYDGRYRYYYMQQGFAISTVLEKIDKNGNPDPDERWYSTAASTHFNLYDIFSTIFFAQSSHFRMMAFTFCPKETPVLRSPAVFDSMATLLQDSYTTLPQDLEAIALPDKTVTILVYHFYQSDVGEVPLLDVTNRLSVADHLKNSRLNEILR